MSCNLAATASIIKVNSNNTPQQHDVLKDLQTVISPVVSRPRSEEPAQPYKELISSPVYFSNEKWQECLESHGLIIDTQSKMLTVLSQSVSADLRYDLTAEELTTLTSNSIKDVPIDKRLEVLNNVIKDDFSTAVTMGMLNSKECINVTLHPEIEQELQQKQQEEQQRMMPLMPEEVQQEFCQPGDAMVHGQDLGYENENKGWYRGSIWP